MIYLQNSRGLATNYILEEILNHYSSKMVFEWKEISTPYMKNPSHEQTTSRN